jgi:hypothetical protein
MNPLTATLNIRFVVALYSVLRIVPSEGSTKLAPPETWQDAVEMVENDLRTRGESSLSTRKACRAAEARRAAGRGRSIVLGGLVSLPEEDEAEDNTNSEQGNSGSIWAVMMLALLVDRLQE